MILILQKKTNLKHIDIKKFTEKTSNIKTSKLRKIKMSYNLQLCTPRTFNSPC